MQRSSQISVGMVQTPPAVITASATATNGAATRPCAASCSQSNGVRSAAINTAVFNTSALVALSLQHSLVGILVRQSRIIDGGAFLPQTGVILQEAFKFIASIILAFLAGESLSTVANDPWELTRAGVPALLYLVQNNLQYVALGYLDAATYVVTYQLKILAAAVLSVIMLKKRLSLQKWTALLLLVIGVSVVQLAGTAQAPAESKLTHVPTRAQQLIGLVSVLITCLLSGAAGVYTELLMKRSSVTLWVRNVQLAIFSIIIGVFGLVFTDDMAKVRANGFFYGYNGWVVASVVNNSLGGLLIAVIIKYADNILKNFATSVSIVLTTAASVVMLGLEASWLFLGGVSIVCSATFLYGINVSPQELIRKQLEALSRSGDAKNGKTD